MIDSSKKQPQRFPQILRFEDIESLKGKECLDPDIPKCLKEEMQQREEPRPVSFSAHRTTLQSGGSEVKSRHNPAQRRTPPAAEDPPALLALSPALSPAASEPACPSGHKRQKDCCRRGAVSLSRAPFCGSASSGFFPSLRASSGRAGPVQPGVEVFVDGVPGGALRVELCDLFEAAVPGVVENVALMKQFTFIHLCDEAAAERAIQKLSGHLLHCHRVVVEFSRPRPTHTIKTFVGNVLAACTSGELRVLFQEFGPVIECHIVKGVGEASLWPRNLLCTCSEVLLCSPFLTAIPAIETNSALRSPSLTSCPAVAGLTLHNCWMSGEAIDELPERYLEKLTQLFEEHKAKYGIELSSVVIQNRK
ncbi:uncharacterized protein LOC120299670 [Crotalus tigris]|uniref:uncharacterized protein LOC120299670 n=1 Tax=Crotalus tigris TaxID=88082 RepID=UPI00192F11E8|nr:uncharacterized protein LOC120299670 [Crotalus tigris]